MQFRQLKHYNLENTLTKDLSVLFTLGLKSASHLKEAKIAERIYCVYLQVTSSATVSNYNAINVINNEQRLNQQYRQVVGFIYDKLDNTLISKYSYVKSITRFFHNLVQIHRRELPPLKPSTNEISDDIEACIAEFKKVPINNERLRYFEGWQVLCGQGKSFNLNLSLVYDSYGADFTNQLHRAMTDFARTQTSATFRGLHVRINTLFQSLINFMPSIADLQYGMSSERVHITMMWVYNEQLLSAKYNEYSMKVFHAFWATIVALFYELVHRKLFEEPLIEIAKPVFKSSLHQHKSHKKQDVEGNAFNDKLITRVPLSYTDSQAKEKIFDTIVNDINYVKYCCEAAVSDIMCRYHRFEYLAERGEIKRMEETVRLKNKPKKCGFYNPVRVGEKFIENTFATYRNSPFVHPSAKSYIHFLGFYGKGDALSRHLVIPKQETLYPFILLLINEHPKITESWLSEWKLFDNGRQVGFKQSGNQWIAVSAKNRKGAKKAQQEVILNTRSKYLVECIIKLTTLTRKYLVSINNDDYEYMLHTVAGVVCRPQRLNKFQNPSTRNTRDKFISLFVRNPFNGKANINRDSSYIEQLICDLSLTKFRASCGVRVYLETKSVHAMSEALGHDYYQPALINRYLPDPLWNYFTNRWVRLFQNALVYEAMKDSEYLFGAVDFSPDELDEFIKNHHFGELPAHLKNGKVRPVGTQNYSAKGECGVFPISVALLQWFIAIVDFVDGCPERDGISPIAKKWFESAILVISQIQLVLSEKTSLCQELAINDDVLDMYVEARANPLTQPVVEGALLC